MTKPKITSLPSVFSYPPHHPVWGRRELWHTFEGARFITAGIRVNPQGGGAVWRHMMMLIRGSEEVRKCSCCYGNNGHYRLLLYRTMKWTTKRWFFLCFFHCCDLRFPLQIWISSPGFQSPLSFSIFVRRSTDRDWGRRRLVHRFIISGTGYLGKSGCSQRLHRHLEQRYSRARSFSITGTCVKRVD